MHKEGVFSALGARSVCCGKGAGYEYFHSHDVMCNCGPLQHGKAHAVLCERVKPVWSFATVRHVVICNSMAMLSVCNTEACGHLCSQLEVESIHKY